MSVRIRVHTSYMSIYTVLQGYLVALNSPSNICLCPCSCQMSLNAACPERFRDPAVSCLAAGIDVPWGNRSPHTAEVRKRVHPAKMTRIAGTHPCEWLHHYARHTSYTVLQGSLVALNSPSNICLCPRSCSRLTRCVPATPLPAPHVVPLAAPPWQ